ncbi:SUMF1/EgtB/PvdO family nonheme iron enzyme [Desulfobacterales bacterium HSG2]|nr:SUMF1/EgtB/PvdO family nonheme iron enzyme [Desulfobacterales bacterium HSG2]
MDRLVILGCPGGGKSTLVNHIASQLTHLRMGTADSEKTSLPGWTTDQPPLPVRIILRQFAAWMKEDWKKAGERLVWEYLEYLLKDWGCADFFPALKRTLDEKGGVIFFDGLDEVRETDEEKKRTRMVEAIREFAKPLKKCRFLITCREYAYRREDGWRLPEADFPVVELDMFRLRQIRAFTRTWYRLTGKWKGWTEKQSLAEAEKLCEAVESWPHLRELGQYPLLLTLMAQVHGRDGYLPKDRADLYERAVNLLLAHWENRITRDIDGGCTVKPGLVAELGVRVDTLRSALEHVALSAHERQEREGGDRSECADIPREDLRQELAIGLGNDLNRAEKVIAYIQYRAGLLQARDNRTFAFPHRTFQEYLAATGIMKKSDFEEFLRKCVLRDLSWWREVFLLAAGSSQNTPKNIYDMVDCLLPYNPGDTELTSDISAVVCLSARAMGETEFVKHVETEQASRSGRYSKIHGRVQNWLLAALKADTALTPRERNDAGTALNWVGDPRFNPNNWYLANDDELGFVRIPAGEFLMGSDKKRDKHAKDNELLHTVELSEYHIARYPVTVAQFGAFVQESGYQPEEDWEEDNEYDNHPVVNVSWHDAVAYCEWLTEKLREQGHQWQIQLPTEAQWEKAARGTDGRIYPWGDEADPDRANYDDTGIGKTSAVGCFPAGAGPYDCLDMAGNVWEWCRDWYGDYPSGRVSNPAGPDTGSNRVKRGGGWGSTAGNCRSAYRYGNSPGYRYGILGLRLALSPGQQGG